MPFWLESRRLGRGPAPVDAAGQENLTEFAKRSYLRDMPVIDADAHVDETEDTGLTSRRRTHPGNRLLRSFVRALSPLEPSSIPAWATMPSVV